MNIMVYLSDPTVIFTPFLVQTVLVLVFINAKISGSHIIYLYHLKDLVISFKKKQACREDLFSTKSCFLELIVVLFFTF